MPILQVESLTRAYGATVAVRDVSFSVEEGEIVGFLGPNGAGKTSTMRVIAGSLGATQGRVIVGGFDVATQPAAVKRIVGYMPETPPLYVDMTVRSFLRFCARIKAVSDPAGAAERAMRRVGLSEVAHRVIDHLSKGYRQRVGLAAALVHDPRLLILDEPASGLDPKQRVEIRSLVQELAGGHVTVVLSTHVLPEVEQLCTRVIIVNRGRIVAQDRMEALSEPGRVVTVEVRRDAERLAAAIGALDGVTEVEALRPGALRVVGARDLREDVADLAAPFGILELTGRRGLEEAFLRLTRED
jgi:ABC-2 type transport system ATP-binding protein